MNGTPSIQDVKARFTIFDAWAALGLEGRAGRCVRSPFRDDRRASFSVFGDGTKAKDHATGESYDVIDFVARALDCASSMMCAATPGGLGRFTSDFRCDSSSGVMAGPRHRRCQLHPWTGTAGAPALKTYQAGTQRGTHDPH